MIAALSGGRPERSVNGPERSPTNALCAWRLNLAAKAGDAGEVPVGAVVVNGTEVMRQGANAREATQDPTAHAEVVALRHAAKAHRVMASFGDAPCTSPSSRARCAPERWSQPG